MLHKLWRFESSLAQTTDGRLTGSPTPLPPQSPCRALDGPRRLTCFTALRCAVCRHSFSGPFCIQVYLYFLKFRVPLPS